MPKNYKVKNEKVKKLMQGLGTALKDMMPKGWGFTLLLFDYTVDVKNPGSLFYISTADRQDSIKLLEEFLVKMKEEENEKQTRPR